MPRYDDNSIIDFTGAINKVPRAWNLLDSMNLSETVGVKTETATVDVITEKTVGFGDKRRGAERNFMGSETSITKHLTIPFFPLDGAVKPQDLQNLREIGTADDLKALNPHVTRIMERIRRSHGVIREKAMMEAIKGNAYVPNGTTEAYDYFNVFEVSGKKLEVAMDLGNTATDVIESQEQVFGHIIDNADDGASSYEIVCLASPEYFTALLKNDSLQTAYMYYADRQEPLRDRQGGNSIYRQFTHGNVRYIEYRGSFQGQRLIPANEAFYVPMGIMDMFKTFQAPADHLDYVNTEGQDLYMWLYRDERGRRMDIESETAFLVVNQRPELVVRATAAASF